MAAEKDVNQMISMHQNQRLQASPSKKNIGISAGRETSPTGNSDEGLYRDSSAYTIGLEKPTSLKNFENNHIMTEHQKGEDKKKTKMRKIMGNMPRSGKSLTTLKPELRRQSMEQLDLTNDSMPKIGYNLKMNQMRNTQ